MAEIKITLSSSWWDSSTTEKLTNEDPCFMYQKRRYENKNETSPKFEISRGFERVPEILVMNIITALIILLVFTILRKRAGHYGRLALLHKKRSSSTHKTLGYDMFPKLMKSVSAVPKQTATTEDEQHEQDLSQQKSLEGESTEKSNKTPEMQFQLGLPTEKSKKTHISDKYSFLSEDTGFFSWFFLIRKITDEHIEDKCGIDSVHYSKFQTIIIRYLLIISIVGLLVILPVHLTGNNIHQLNENKFAQTTINNVDENSPLLWLHFTLLLVFNLLCIYFARLFATLINSVKEKPLMPTILISNLKPALSGNVDMIKAYFREAFPYFAVMSVNFAYDYNKLKECQTKLKNSQGALKAILKANSNQTMRVSRFSRKRISCKQYYQNNVQKYVKLMHEVKIETENHPLNICFVKFESLRNAQRVVKDFRKCSCWNIPIIYPKLPETKLDEQLEPKTWDVSIAPHPDDINWENLSIRQWYWRSLLINFGVFLLLFFLTTPSIAFQLLLELGETIRIDIKAIQDLGFLFADLVPIILLLIFACLLPCIVSYSEYLIGHWTISKENLVLIRKETICLMFMVLILPSFSLPSVKALIEYFVVGSSVFETINVNDTNSKWSCMFLPHNGAFFTNYVISTTWITCAMEFLRFGVLFCYSIRRLWARSKFERFMATSATIFTFPFGDNYAWMLLIFSITIVYGVMFPLILPCGLLYFVFKYYVDRYNMFFAYTPGRISRKQHLAALNFLLFSFILAQFVLFLFLFLRDNDLMKWKNLCMLIVFMFSLFGYIWHLMFGFLWSGTRRNDGSIQSQKESVKECKKESKLKKSRQENVIKQSV